MGGGGTPRAPGEPDRGNTLQNLSESLSEKGARMCRKPAAGRSSQSQAPEIETPLRLVEDDTAALWGFQALRDHGSRCPSRTVATTRRSRRHPYGRACHSVRADERVGASKFTCTVRAFENELPNPSIKFRILPENRIPPCPSVDRAEQRSLPSDSLFKRTLSTPISQPLFRPHRPTADGATCPDFAGR